MHPILTIALNPAVDVSCSAALVRPTRKIRTDQQRYFPGGGGINVARVISILGGQVTLVYLSGGVTGKLLDECLQPISIHVKRYPVNTSTRVSFTVHEDQTGFEYRFVPEGSEVTESEIIPVVNWLEAGPISEFAFVVASGSLPPGLAADTYVSLAKLAKIRGVRFVLDTSGDALEVALHDAPLFLVKPSLGELEKYCGESLDEQQVREVALSLVGTRQIENIVVSMGGQGAILANSSGASYIPGKHVTVKSAVGAGDSFVGAMVYGLMEGMDVRQAAELGVCAGAAAVMTDGTELCRQDAVYALMN